MVRAPDSRICWVVITVTEFGTFEIGCSIGVLTRKLARRCERLLAVDLLPEILARAPARCADLPGVSFPRLAVPPARSLRPGGTLVYSTCTISRAENEDIAAELPGYASTVAADDLGALEPRLASRADRRFLQILPQRDRTTGFFIARFRRES